jgi:hypothetical protein
MDEYLADVVEAVRKSLEGNELAILDRERLRKAERIGPSCARKLAG